MRFKSENLVDCKDSILRLQFIPSLSQFEELKAQGLVPPCLASVFNACSPCLPPAFASFEARSHGCLWHCFQSCCCLHRRCLWIEVLRCGIPVIEAPSAVQSHSVVRWPALGPCRPTSGLLRCSAASWWAPSRAVPSAWPPTLFGLSFCFLRRSVAGSPPWHLQFFCGEPRRPSAWQSTRQI